jgi:hypothetical protein
MVCFLLMISTHFKLHCPRFLSHLHALSLQQVKIAAQHIFTTSAQNAAPTAAMMEAYKSPPRASHLLTGPLGVSPAGWFEHTQILASHHRYRLGEEYLRVP